uniref:Uncharacterized protein n=1 Tax=Avena sativa TaxID=4498 RepID=A0ACD5X009_AVESA
MQNMSRQELVASLRRKSSGFSRGASMYRGVTRHHQHGRWQARIGRVAGNKDLYLGTFATQEEAAEAYDIAALKFRGDNAVTNFEPSRYNLEAIAHSDLPINGPGRRLNSHNYKPAAPEAQQGQITFATSAPPFPQQLSNGVSPYLLHSLLQLPPSAPMHALPLSSYGVVGEPSFHWPFGDVEQKVQLDDSKMEHSCRVRERWRVPRPWIDRPGSWVGNGSGSTRFVFGSRSLFGDRSCASCNRSQISDCNMVGSLKLKRKKWKFQASYLG